MKYIKSIIIIINVLLNDYITINKIKIIIYAYLFNKVKKKVRWHATKYGDPLSEFVLCI